MTGDAGSGLLSALGMATIARTRTPTRTAVLVLSSLLVALLVALGPGPSAAPVLAACAPARPIEESMVLADLVVVGTVTRTENGGRWITVRVEERWRAPESLPDTIEVRAGPEPGAATSIDRVFVQARYLFFLTSGPEYFVDNACTATTLWTEDLAALRPSGVSPAPNVVADAPLGPLDQVELVPVVALFGALVIVLVSYMFILRARRRPPDWMR
ncbi:MAG: hypothetical protein ACYC65_06410 [Candidatus Limnocylindrales bacterium]